MPRYEVDTPVLAIDLDIMERNISRMAEKAKRHGVKLRPHIKTHKSPQIAQLQVAAGATGVTAAKLGEAEVMVRGGIEDVLIAYPIVGEKKLARLEKLVTDAKVTVSLDSVDVAEGISRVGRRLGRRIPVYLEVDTGLKRVGVRPGAPATELAQAVARLQGVEVRGVMTHGGHVGAATSKDQLEELSRAQAELLAATAEEIRRAGVEVAEVSPGSTLAAFYEADTPGVTEIRPGTYVFNDRNTVDRWMATPDECAAFVITTVVSRPAPDRVIIDAGSKTLSADQSLSKLGGYGLVLGGRGFQVVRLSEEHGVVQIDPDSNISIGEQLLVVPNHICPAVNLSDHLVTVRQGSVVGEIPVLARGART